jgi:hypothetical protein
MHHIKQIFFKNQIIDYYRTKRYINDYYKKTNHATKKRTIGFKLFPGQLRPKVFNLLLESKLSKVILLRRKNLLKAALSYEIAKRTNQWDVSQKKDFTPFQASIEDIKKFLFFYSYQLSAARNTIVQSRTPMIEVEYETLFTVESIKKIINFLNEPIEEKLFDLIKKGSMNNKDRYSNILNIDKIESLFSGEEFGFLNE